MAITLVSGQVADALIESTSVNVVLPNNPTAGNLIVVGVIIGTTSFTATCADGSGNAYTATPGSPVTHAVGARAYIFYLKNAPDNASKTITVSLSASAVVTAHAGEFAGANKTAPFDLEASHNTATAQTNINDPTLTPSSANSLIFAIAAGNLITSANSPWAAVGTPRDGNLGEYVIQTTKIAQAINYTQSSASVWLAMEAAFKIAGTDVTVNATSTTTSVVNKRMPKVILATATSTSTAIKRTLKRVSANAVTTAFVSAFEVFIGSTNVVVNATVNTTSTVKKGVSKIVDAIATTVSFSGILFNVTLNAIVNTALLLVSSTQKIIFTFGKNIIQALDQNLFATRRTIFAYQEEELITAPDDFNGSFICDVDVGAGLWSGASGTFTIDFDHNE